MRIHSRGEVVLAEWDPYLACSSEFLDKAHGLSYFNIINQVSGLPWALDRYGVPLNPAAAIQGDLLEES